MQKKGVAKVSVVALLILTFIIASYLGYTAGQNALLPEAKAAAEREKSLEQKLNQLTTEKQLLEKRLNETKEQAQMLSEEIGNKTAQITSLEEELGQIKERAETWQQEINSTREELNRTKAEAEALEAQFNQTKAQLLTDERELSNKQEDIRKLERDLKKAQKPWLYSWMTIYMPVPREVNQINYYQHVESVTITSNLQPSGTTRLVDDMYGRDGNVEMAVYWNERHQGEIVVTIEAILQRKITLASVKTEDPYPVSMGLIPEYINNSYLQSSQQIQSNHPEISALAQTLAQGFTKEVDVVENTIKWVHENVHYADSWTYHDAVRILQAKQGTCMDYAILAVALLRAQRIPARIVCGPTVPLPPEERYWSHATVEAYYPEIGWIDYDPTLSKDSIVTTIITGVTASFEYGTPGGARYEIHYAPTVAKTCESWWEIEDLGENRVKVTATIRLTPAE